MAVICGKPKYSDQKRDTFVNPQILIEVLSPSTEAYDRGIKFGHYRSLTSLQEYLLVSQHSHIIEQFIRRENGAWPFQVIEGLASRVKLPSLDVEMALSEIYYNIDLINQ